MGARKVKKLTPPDLLRCQAEKPNGESFMTLGGGPKLERCRREPTVIATEIKPGKDGQIGSMSLCDKCAAVLQKQMPGTTSIRRITLVDFIDEEKSPP